MSFNSLSYKRKWPGPQCQVHTDFEEGLHMVSSIAFLISCTYWHLCWQANSFHISPKLASAPTFNCTYLKQSANQMKRHKKPLLKTPIDTADSAQSHQNQLVGNRTIQLTCPEIKSCDHSHRTEVLPNCGSDETRSLCSCCDLLTAGDWAVSWRSPLSP